ncbi:MAG TPA: glutamine-hydrolyzing carbamoyl-phosphate synthase small subunit [Candidatus Thermoplasmatota archaeon]|nr:glutamine-hydrolyzing carbamoyl-phosphate synthase small subunit [Candidatus Thermoplasmatota archaeon]
MERSAPAWLILEDGTVVEGEAFGHTGTAYGELVFTTGMTGYQESLTDPSYNGQVLLFTYPLIGNYGVSTSDWESDRVWPRAVVVREWCRQPSHRASTMDLHQWLVQQRVPGISGVDTRALTIKVREKGCLRCFVTHDPGEVEALKAKVQAMPGVEADNLAGEASVPALRRYGRNDQGALEDGSSFDPGAYTVAVLDTGIKRNILRNLARRFNVLHHPWDATMEDVLAHKPHALFIANGPGDPAHPEIQGKTVRTIRAVSEKVPTFGICYGNQLTALAYGAKTYKMPFGHRGANIPVRDERTGTVRITSQNHGFAVDPKSVVGTGLRVWELCPNDGAVEALMHERLPVFTTQYHPEACPGPWDSAHLFDAFHQLVDDVHRGRWQPGRFPELAGGHGGQSALVPAS